MKSNGVKQPVDLILFKIGAFARPIETRLGHMISSCNQQQSQAMCTRIGLFTFKFCLCDLSLDGTTLEQNFQHPLIASDFYCH
jgi:hypothetical protein